MAAVRWASLGIGALLAVLLLLLALSPSYSGPAGLDLQLTRLFAPLHTYLFRNAVFNTGWLLLGVYVLSLMLGWTWAITGTSQPVRPLLLLPLFLPGVLTGLLWRPFFVGWLDLAQAELSLLVTAFVLLWRAVPLAVWLFSGHRYAWLKLIPLCALLVLFDGDLVLTLTRGEPFNAAHSWASWIVQQLWITRAWGYAASMTGALAVVVALMAWWASQRTAAAIAIPYGSPLGLISTLIWIAGPFLLPLLAFLQAPATAIRTLLDLGALLWLVNGALLWGGATLLATRFAWRLPTARARQMARTLTVTMLPIATVALAYLVEQLPFLGSLWVLIGLVGLFTAGLLMGDDETPVPQRHPSWVKAAGYAMLVMAHSFPLQLVMQLPPPAWTPTLGILWTLVEAPQAGAAFGAVLLLYGLWAGLGAWFVAHTKIPT
jgi:hypothetical protein